MTRSEDAAPIEGAPSELPAGAAASALLVISPGTLTLVQDRGRPGWAGLGVGESGAADRRALDAANRLVGNRASAAALETVLGGLELRAEGTVVLAVSGAPVPVQIERSSGRREHEPVLCLLVLGAGDTVRLDPPPHGLRSYLAVRGGIDAEETLGSRSTDLLSGLGPRPLAQGDRLRIGTLHAAWPAATAIPAAPHDQGPVVLALRLGPRDDWFTTGAIERLLTAEWLVTPESNRVGIRLRALDGQPGLDRADPAAELPSEGMVTGSLQVPPDGQPVLFHRDHPVTGGYPVMAVVDAHGLDRAAQLVPGEAIRFRLARGRL